MELTISVSGLESIDKDLEEIKGQISTAVRNSMDIVGIQMKEALKSHINTDVYEEYEPVKYERRSKNTSFGTPLDDMEANTLIFNKGAGLTLQYLPTGEHRNNEWSDAHGDDLVGRIEKKNPSYNWGSDDIPERPFFQNFVSEMTEEGELERYFMEAMAGNGFIVESDGTGVVRESEDGDY